MKKFIALALTAILAISAFAAADFTPAKAETETDLKTIAELSYQATAEDAKTDLADSYGSKNSGYHFSSGAVSGSALLFASVSGKGLETITNEPDPDNPDTTITNTPFRKIEWSKAEYTIGETTENVVPVMTAGKKNLWGETPYFLIQFNTKGYKDIHFSTELTGSSKGPKNLKLQYSADGISFTDIENGSYAIPKDPSTKIMKTAFDLDLPNDAFTDKDIVFLRIIATDNATINPDDPANDTGFLGTSSGELAINNIKITGRVNNISEKPTPTPANPNTSGTITDNPAATTSPLIIAPSVTPKPSTKKAKKQTFKLNKKKLTLKKGKTYKLKLICSPKSLGKKLTWKSSKKKVATVSKNGKVKALRKGKTTITVKNKSGKKATCKVIVKKR